MLKYPIKFEAVYHSWFDKFDVILPPTVSTTAPAVGAQAPDGDFETVWNNVLGFAAFTPPMNVAGAASMSVPLHQSEDGMPLASMFSGRKGDDGLLLALAYELEAARPWIGR
ncbi:MAG: amidase family protein [Robiginitomaculum sp.]